jgi:uncharacterized OsmC-like protein
VLLGSNQGPNALELVLQALGFCYAVGYVANAAAQGIEITRMDYEIEGDFDVRAFPGPGGAAARLHRDPCHRPGVESQRDDEQLTELCRYVQQTSPVRDVLANPVPVTTSLEIV